VYALHTELENLLPTVMARLLKPGILMSGEVFTSLLDNLDNYLQDNIVRKQVDLSLNAQ